MGRHRGIGRKRKGKKQGAPTPTKKSRMRVQQVSAEKAKKHLHDTREVENWITKMNEIASEAGVTAKKGLGYGAGEARIIIRAVINTIHARKGGLKWSTAKQQPQLQEVYDDMAGLFGMSHMVVRELFEDFIENKVITIKDESARGRGSVNAEPKRLRTNEQYAAIEAFGDFCNSKADGGKCTLEQIQKYMEEGPHLNSDDPQIDSGLRVHSKTQQSNLKDATIEWLKENKSEALKSKVELLFREKDWKIIWTPPYCPLNFSPLSSFGALGSSALLGGILGHGTWKRLAINLELASMGVSLEKETEKENIPRSTLQAAGRKRRGSSMLGSAKTARTLGFLAFQVT